MKVQLKHAKQFAAIPVLLADLNKLLAKEALYRQNALFAFNDGRHHANWLQRRKDVIEKIRILRQQLRSVGYMEDWTPAPTKLFYAQAAYA